MRRYIITSDGQAEMWHEFPGLRVYALPCMLTVPAVPNLRRQLVTVEFTLQGTLLKDLSGTFMFSPTAALWRSTQAELGIDRIEHGLG